MKRPRISIVTPSYNQGRFIRAAIESVLDQDYPDLEHIVVDGMSSDGTPAVLREYPHLRVIRERDAGQADALNKGFRMATGDILCFLNSDDTLEPGALHRVAGEIDPAANRHVIMGRCRFVREDGSFTGIEHPSAFASFRHVLEIWKGYTIPQPAVFWTREVWENCGPMEEGPVLDYDLFCRFARRYRFHCVDQVLANYRLHDDSKTARSSEAERLDASIRVSRKYWGSPLAPAHWRLWFSLADYRLHRVGRSRRWLTTASESWKQGRRLRSAPYVTAAAVLAPEVVFYIGMYPFLLRRAGRMTLAARRFAASHAGLPPQTRAYLDYTAVWSDGWAGPRVIVNLAAAGGEKALRIRGMTELRRIGRQVDLAVSVDGQRVGVHSLRQSADFDARFDLPDPLAAGEHTIEVRASGYFIPLPFAQDDYRPLSWRLNRQGIEFV
jgi:glycosyltransferase involved in cell wall biosynthesis